MRVYVDVAGPPIDLSMEAGAVLSWYAGIEHARRLLGAGDPPSGLMPAYEVHQELVDAGLIEPAPGPNRWAPTEAGWRVFEVLTTHV